MGNDEFNVNIQNKRYLLLLENRINEMNTIQTQLQNENQQLNNTINRLKNKLNNKLELPKNDNDSILNYQIEEIPNIINQLKNENHDLKIKNNELINEQRITKTKLRDIEKYSLTLKKSNIFYENKINEYETSNSWKLTKPLRKIKKI